MGKYGWLIGLVAFVGVFSIAQKGADKWASDMGNGCLGVFGIFCVIAIVYGINSLSKGR